MRIVEVTKVLIKTINYFIERIIHNFHLIHHVFLQIVFTNNYNKKQISETFKKWSEMLQFQSPVAPSGSWRAKLRRICPLCGKDGSILKCRCWFRSHNTLVRSLLGYCSYQFIHKYVSLEVTPHYSFHTTTPLLSHHHTTPSTLLLPHHHTTPSTPPHSIITNATSLQRPIHLVSGL